MLRIADDLHELADEERGFFVSFGSGMRDSFSLRVFTVSARDFSLISFSIHRLIDLHRYGSSSYHSIHISRNFSATAR